MIYLTTLSVAQIIKRQIMVLMNNELKRIRKDEIMA
jgi:hypothetical protein